jgi:hypothetical protein
MMGRVSRLSYKEAARAKVSGRFKELVVVFLLAIGGILVSVTLNAQVSHHGAKKYSRTEKRQCQVLAKKRNQKTRAGRRHFFQAANADAKVTKPAFQGFSNTTNAFEQSIIKEMVANHLKEGNSNNPIELAPLLFSRNETKLIATDPNPFFIALEFARQGKTIVIDQSEGNELAQEVRSLMINMGVPESRIHIQEFIPKLLIVEQSQESDRRVEFKAI